MVENTASAEGTVSYMDGRCRVRLTDIEILFRVIRYQTRQYKIASYHTSRLADFADFWPECHVERSRSRKQLSSMGSGSSDVGLVFSIIWCQVWWFKGRSSPLEKPKNSVKGPTSG